MLVIVPVAQARVPVGVIEEYLPCLDPQEPLIGVLFRDAVHVPLVVPPFKPVQVQVIEEPRPGKE
jgi:hypothetical protein